MLVGPALIRVLFLVSGLEVAFVETDRLMRTAPCSFQKCPSIVRDSRLPTDLPIRLRVGRWGSS
jgi:hypothetical protein